MYEVKVAHLCLTVCNPMDYTVHGILQARILEWVAFPFSRKSYQPRDRTQISHIAGGFFTSWTTRKAQYMYLFNALNGYLRNKNLNLPWHFLVFHWTKRLIKWERLGLLWDSGWLMLFLNVLLFFNWSIVDLQCYVNFCCVLFLLWFFPGLWL